VIIIELELNLFFMGFCFLDAQNVRIMLFDEWQKQIFPQHRANAIDVPGINLHSSHYSSLFAGASEVQLTSNGRNSNTH